MCLCSRYYNFGANEPESRGHTFAEMSKVPLSHIFRSISGGLRGGRLTQCHLGGLGWPGSIFPFCRVFLHHLPLFPWKKTESRNSIINHRIFLKILWLYFTDSAEPYVGKLIISIYDLCFVPGIYLIYTQRETSLFTMWHTTQILL